MTTTATITTTPITGEKNFVQDFAADCKLRGMTTESIRRYKSCISIYQQFLQSKRLSFLNVEKQVLKDFIGYLRVERKVGQSTLEHYFSALSTFYEYLVFEEITDNNPVLPIRKRYLRSFKTENNGGEATRKLISVEEMSMLLNSILNIRDRAIIILLAKTGLRRNELIQIDIEDINWKEHSITLKHTPKRSNRVVFFDDECARVLRSWQAVRQKSEAQTNSLFINERGNRLDRNGVYNLVIKWACKVGLHNPESKRLEDSFSPHCLRHWFTTHLRKAGMPREFIQELRGDRRKEAIDIYDHIDKEELRKAYLAYIPQLNI